MRGLQITPRSSFFWVIFVEYLAHGEDQIDNVDRSVTLGMSSKLGFWVLEILP